MAPVGMWPATISLKPGRYQDMFVIDRKQMNLQNIKDQFSKGQPDWSGAATAGVIISGAVPRTPYLYR
jgi:hypothetical protein